MTTSIAIGVGVVFVVLVGFAMFQTTEGDGEPSDFEVSLYQGDQNVSGSNVNFADLLDDGKPVVLNFWGGDCPPCRAEMPAFQRLYEAHQHEITMLGLDVGRFMGTRRSALALIEELGITYPAGAPNNSKPLIDHAVRGLPATIFFGADGTPIRRWDGLIPESQLKSIVNSLLGPS